MTAHIDVGDRVRIVGNTAGHGSSDLSKVQGHEGVVERNDGFGLCRVLLDSGRIVHAWNNADLERVS